MHSSSSYSFSSAVNCAGYFSIFSGLVSAKIARSDCLLRDLVFPSTHLANRTSDRTNTFSPCLNAFLLFSTTVVLEKNKNVIHRPMSVRTEKNFGSVLKTQPRPVASDSCQNLGEVFSIRTSQPENNIYFLSPLPRGRELP